MPQTFVLNEQRNALEFTSQDSCVTVLGGRLKSNCVSTQRQPEAYLRAAEAADISRL